MADQTLDVYFHELICDNITDESGTGRKRDEVYIRIVGRTPSSNISARLPRSHHGDDYYQFFDHQVSNVDNPKNWRVQDDAIVGEPQIWSGRLKPGEKAEFFIVILEQDNADIQPVVAALKAGLNESANKVGNDPIAAGAVAAAQEFVNQLPDFNHDVIGAFYLKISNINNGADLQTEWVPLKEVYFQNLQGSTTFLNSDDYYAKSLSWKRKLSMYQSHQGQTTQAFNFASLHGGRYRGIVAINWTNLNRPVKAALKYRITEFDACSPNSLLRVYNISLTTFRTSAVTKVLKPGDVASTYVSSRTWFWKCFQAGREQEKGYDHTNSAVATTRYIWVERAEAGGQIRWYCFSEEDW